MLIEKSKKKKSEFKFYNLHCKNSQHTNTSQHHPFSQAVKYTHRHAHFSSFVRTGQLAYLCNIEGKPKKIHQHEIHKKSQLHHLVVW